MLVTPAGLLMRPGQLKLNTAAPPAAPPTLPLPPRPRPPFPAAAAAAAGGRVTSPVGAVRLRRSQSLTVPSMSLLLTRVWPSCGRNCRDVTLRRAELRDAPAVPADPLTPLLLGVAPAPPARPVVLLVPGAGGLLVWWCAAGVVMLMRPTGASCMRLRVADQVEGRRRSQRRMPPSREPGDARKTGVRQQRDCMSHCARE
jgi:hypothetical protein